MTNPSRIEEKIVAELRRARLDKKLSQEKLAELADIHPVTISMIERGKRHPTLLMTLRLTNALGIKLGKVITAVES